MSYQSTGPFCLSRSVCIVCPLRYKSSRKRPIVRNLFVLHYRASISFRLFRKAAIGYNRVLGSNATYQVLAFPQTGHSLEMLRAMTYALVACYGFAWAWSSLEGVNGFAFLMVMSGLVTLPFFLFEICRALARGGCISAVLMVLGALLPPLAVLFFIFGVMFGAVSTIAKFQTFVRRIPLMLGGLVLYALLAVVPSAIRSSAFVAKLGSHSILLVILPMALMGTALMLIALNICERCHHRRSTAAAVMLGGGCYLILFVITLFLPGADDGGSGVLGDLDGDAETHAS